MPTIVLDNGAHSIKVGLAGEGSPSRILPNYAVRPRRERRLYVADQINRDVMDFSSLFYRRPIDRGLVTDWDMEVDIWTRVFGSNNLNIRPQDCSLLCTEPMFNPSTLRTTMDEVIFERFGFSSLYRTSSPALAVTGFQHQTMQTDDTDRLGANAAIVVDAGYSFTHVVPVFQGVPLNYATKRINVGGKAMANYLKELISFRVFNVMDETYVMEALARQSCFVSLNYLQDLHLSRKARSSPIAKTYVLPGPNTAFKGILKEVKSAAHAGEEEQTLSLNNERFTVPELLFSPSDVGIPQAGIPETIVQSILACPPQLQPVLFNNVLLIGGNTLFPNFRARVEQKLRELAPTEYKVRVCAAPDPISCAWMGGSLLANSVDFPRITVTKEEWQEYGETICVRKFTHD